MMTETALLREWQRYIKVHGWVQGAYSAPNGEVCVMGAEYNWCYGKGIGLWDFDTRTAASTALLDVVRELWPDRVKSARLHPLAAFNDHPLTTFDDVMRAYDVAIERNSHE